MKKVLLLFLALTVAFGTITSVEAKRIKKEKAPKVGKKDVLKNSEYKMRKAEFFNADGYGNTYICKVEKQRFCKVKDLDTGLYVLCDRDVSRTQWRSAEVYYRYGRCTKMN